MPVSREISWLESNGNFNALYGGTHASIPRAAVIGWYQNKFCCTIGGDSEADMVGTPIME